MTHDDAMRHLGITPNEHLPYETLAVNAGDYCYWCARTDHTEHARDTIRFAFTFDLVNVVFGTGWYAVPGNDRPVVVSHGDYCAVTFAREHTPTAITAAFHAYIDADAAFVGIYGSPIMSVYAGDYCRIDSDAAWLRGMVATYGHGPL